MNIFIIFEKNIIYFSIITKKVYFILFILQNLSPITEVLSLITELFFNVFVYVRTVPDNLESNNRLNFIIRESYKRHLLYIINLYL